MLKAKETFIFKLKQKHLIRGREYNYDKVDYQGAVTPVIVTCLKHGDFSATPNCFLTQSTACPTCRGYGRTTEDLITDFKSVHGDKYDYSKVVFTKMSEKVTIICNKHGEFFQAINDHLHSKAGCPKCRTKVSKAHKKLVDALVTSGYQEDKDFTVNDRTVLYNNVSGKFLELDIYFPEQKLGVEVDGVLFHGKHESSKLFIDVAEVKTRDAYKDSLCKENSINLLRFTDLEITKDLEGVLNTITSGLSNFNV